jgi:hypothetical protein
MPGVNELTELCQELSLLEDVFKKSTLRRYIEENYYMLGNNRYVAYGPREQLTFEDLEKLSGWGTIYTGDRKNFTLEYHAGKITITYDYSFLDHEDGQCRANQVVTIENGIVTSKGDRVFSKNELIDHMCSSIRNAMKEINLDELHQEYNQSKKQELHKFFKDVVPEFKTLIDNVMANQL